MKNVTEKAEKNIINVIDEFDYSTQNETYNEKFREWRKKKDNIYSYSFEKNVRERVYIDGKGFVNDDAVKKERETLSNIFSVIGKAMLIWVVIDSIVGKLIIQFLSIIGVDVHNNFFSTAIYGGSMEIVLSIIAVTIIKLGVTAFYLHNSFKMPGKVEFMGHMNHPSGLFGAIALTLVVCTIVNLPTAYSNDTKDIYIFFKSVNADVAVWNQSEFLIYTIFDVVILSVITEIIFRGAMLGVLRQFGDVFAILITSLTAALLTQDLKEMVTVFVISVVASWGILKTGSLFTAVSVSIVHKMYQLALAVIEVDPSAQMPITRNMFMAAAFIFGAVGTFVVWLRYKTEKKYGIASFSSEIGMKERIITSAKVFPYSAVAVICIVNAVMRLLY